MGSFRFSGAVLDLGGFVDLENIFRTTNTQSNIATAFASIPYSNTPQGNISEFRTTAQFSRLSVKFTDHFKGNDLTGYIETRFQWQRRFQCLSKRERHNQPPATVLRGLQAWQVGVPGGANMGLADAQSQRHRPNADRSGAYLQ